jgi:hypothetical protein
MNLTISTIRCLLPCALAVLAVLAACAPLPSQQPEYPVGRARLVLPQGAWEDLGATNEAIPLLPEAGDSLALQTRAVALRGAGKELLAVLLVQANNTRYPRESVLWTGSCPRQQGVTVDDATHGSHVRVDCLRLKRWVDSPAWLEKNQPGLAQWLAGRKIALDKPYSYVGYRYATEGGALVVVDALVDQRLLRPKTRNNQEFLVAGRPALQWGHDLAQAARVSAGMMDGYLAVPAFPFPAAATP